MDDETDYYHEVNMRSLHYGLNQMKEAKLKNREAAEEEVKLKLNIGAFIRKAIRNGRDKTMSTYWTYKGSLTTPGKNIRIIHFKSCARDKNLTLYLKSVYFGTLLILIILII